MLKRLAAVGLLFAVALAFAASFLTSRGTKVNPKDGAAMVYVPAGKFSMGLAGDDLSTTARMLVPNAPQHAVDLSGFWIYKNDVTVAEYKAFCDATGHDMPPEPSWGWRDDYPVVNVSWNDAQAYAKWAGASLPTEAQWEKAARGTDGRLYPWGNQWDATRCAHSNSKPGDLGSPKPVGSYPSGASPCGALDMAGNVDQWCADWFDEGYYGLSAQGAPATKNPTGPKDGDDRVIRGGSWYEADPAYFYSEFRNSNDPNLRTFNLGFRCASRSE